ncbi:MAG: AAA family ATPase [Gammaproteobacteria bacterium]|nr:AAA family ATPase [Gammaproteobacteria bacterium]
MGLLQDILKWTETLPEWQSDAVRRLLQHEEGCAEQDYVELYLLLKEANGFQVQDGLSAVPLGAVHIPAVHKPGETVVLKAMRELTNVNRIAQDQVLSFAEKGITIVYGGNGSGKSGYARVMKRACRARDQLEEVHPNANDPSAMGNIPAAKFDVDIGGTIKEVPWAQSGVSPEVLSTIAVFDSRCARAYLTSEQDVAYLPYGLDVVEGLANNVIPELSRRLDDEIASINVDSRPYEHLQGDTQVGKLISGLTAKSDDQVMRELGALSEDEEKRIAELNLLLDEADPKAKATELRLSASRLKTLGEKIRSSVSWVSDEALSKVMDLYDAASSAEDAEKKAAEALQSGEVLLPGTGEPIWKALFEAARKYSTEIAYPKNSFPHVDKNAVCPLCQEPLGVAGKRLGRFEEYVKNDIAKNAKEKREELEAARNKIRHANLDINLEHALIEEINNLDQSLIILLKGFEESIEARRKWMLEALDSHEWGEPIKLEQNPRGNVRKLAARQIWEARDFMRATDEDKKRRLLAEREELLARKNLGKSLDSLLELHQRMKDKSHLEICRKQLNTRSISSKSKELASNAVTKELKKSLDEEFRNLGVGHIKTTLKEKNVKGKIFHQLILELPTRMKLNEILSEGEQRAIALGAFLAELSLANHSCGIIFDDPVSSLDHKRRGKVAKRLVEEAGIRQVIVFTHDVVFLYQLKSECEKRSYEPMVCSLESVGNACGKVSVGLPWQHKSFGERLDSLKKAQKRFEKMPWPAEPGEELAGEMIRQYSFMRATIERVVQDLFLNSTVQRFRDYIDVKRLGKVIGLHRDDVDELFRLNQRCHDIVEAHDPASAKDDPPPTANELKKDVDDLEALINSVKARRTQTNSTATMV